MNKFKLFTIIGSVALTILIGGIIVSAAPWSGPTQFPPLENTDPPINTGASAQTKSGPLTINNTFTIKDGQKVCLGGVCITKWIELFAPPSDVWFNDILSISFRQDGPDQSWAPFQVKYYKTKYALSRVRVRGGADDGGYCYAYWGTDHVATTRHAGDIGIYNKDNVNYYGAGSCEGGDGSDRICSPDKYCPAPTFDNNGNAELCQIWWSAGGMTPAEKAVTIPAGTEIYLQGSHTMGIHSDSIQCSLDVQYAPQYSL